MDLGGVKKVGGKTRHSPISTEITHLGKIVGKYIETRVLQVAHDTYFGQRGKVPLLNAFVMLSVLMPFSRFETHSIMHMYLQR